MELLKNNNKEQHDTIQMLIFTNKYIDFNSYIIFSYLLKN